MRGHEFGNMISERAQILEMRLIIEDYTDMDPGRKALRKQRDTMSFFEHSALVMKMTLDEMTTQT